MACCDNPRLDLHDDIKDDTPPFLYCINCDHEWRVAGPVVKIPIPKEDERMPCTCGPCHHCIVEQLRQMKHEREHPEEYE